MLFDIGQRHHILKNLKILFICRMEPFTFGETGLEQAAVKTIDLFTPKVVFFKK